MTYEQFAGLLIYLGIGVALTLTSYRLKKYQMLRDYDLPTMTIAFLFCILSWPVMVIILLIAMLRTAVAFWKFCRCYLSMAEIERARFWVWRANNRLAMALAANPPTISECQTDMDEAGPSNEKPKR